MGSIVMTARIRDRSFLLRLNTEERAMLDRLSHRAGLSISELVRQLVCAENEKLPSTRDRWVLRWGRPTRLLRGHERPEHRDLGGSNRFRYGIVPRHDPLVVSPTRST